MGKSAGDSLSVLLCFRLSLSHLFPRRQLCLIENSRLRVIFFSEGEWYILIEGPKNEETRLESYSLSLGNNRDLGIHSSTHTLQPNVGEFEIIHISSSTVLFRSIGILNVRQW